MGDEHDDPVFESADAGASHTYPMQAGTTLFFMNLFIFLAFGNLNLTPSIGICWHTEAFMIHMHVKRFGDFRCDDDPFFFITLI